MNTISKQEKSFNKNKNTIKKLSKFITSRMFYLLLGLFLTVAIFTVQAAWNSKVSTGQVFTTTLWNDMVDKLVNLDNRVAGVENGLAGLSLSFPHATAVGGDCNTPCANLGAVCIHGFLTSGHGWGCSGATNLGTCICAKIK